MKTVVAVSLIGFALLSLFPKEAEAKALIVKNTCGFLPTDKSVFDNTIILGQAPSLPGREHLLRFSAASDLASGSIGNILQTKLPMKISFFLWANRCVVPASEMGISIPAGANCKTGGNYKPNPWDIHLLKKGKKQTSPKRYWAFFSTYQKANACTRMRIWALLGEHDRAVKIGEDNGFSSSQIVTSAYHEDYEKEAQKFKEHYPLKKKEKEREQERESSVQWPKKDQPYFMDICALPDMDILQEQFGGTLAKNKIHNFLLDYESQDNRQGSMTNEFIDLIAKNLDEYSGGKIGIRIFNNSIGFWGARTSGLKGEHLLKIPKFSNLKGLSIVEYKGTRKLGDQTVWQHLQSQLDLVKGGKEMAANLHKKIFVTYALNNRESSQGAKLNGAKLARQFVKTKGLGGVIVWFEGSRISKPCSSLTLKEDKEISQEEREILLKEAKDRCFFDWQTLKCLLLNDKYCQVSHSTCEDKIIKTESTNTDSGSSTGGSSGNSENFDTDTKVSGTSTKVADTNTKGTNTKVSGTNTKVSDDSSTGFAGSSSFSDTNTKSSDTSSKNSTRDPANDSENEDTGSESSEQKSSTTESEVTSEINSESLEQDSAEELEADTKFLSFLRRFVAAIAAAFRNMKSVFLNKLNKADKSEVLSESSEQKATTHQESR